MCKRIEVGDTVQSFKREIEMEQAKFPEACGMIYIYKVMAVAEYTETQEKLVIYQALYQSSKLGVKKYSYYACPYDTFMGEVDHKKYPNVKQKWRFEKVEDIS